MYVCMSLSRQAVVWGGEVRSRFFWWRKKKKRISRANAGHAGTVESCKGNVIRDTNKNKKNNPENIFYVRNREFFITLCQKKTIPFSPFPPSQKKTKKNPPSPSDEKDKGKLTRTPRSS